MAHITHTIRVIDSSCTYMNKTLMLWILSFSWFLMFDLGFALFTKKNCLMYTFYNLSALITVFVEPQSNHNTPLFIHILLPHGIKSNLFFQIQYFFLIHIKKGYWPVNIGITFGPLINPTCFDFHWLLFPFECGCNSSILFFHCKNHQQNCFIYYLSYEMPHLKWTKLNKFTTFIVILHNFWSVVQIHFDRLFFISIRFANTLTFHESSHNFTICLPIVIHFCVQ